MNLKKTRIYKDTFVGKGSQLDTALAESDKAAKKVYEETSKRYEQQYSQDARDYFAEHMKRHKQGTHACTAQHEGHVP